MFKKSILPFLLASSVWMSAQSTGHIEKALDNVDAMVSKGEYSDAVKSIPNIQIAIRNLDKSASVFGTNPNPAEIKPEPEVAHRFVEKLKRELRANDFKSAYVTSFMLGVTVSSLNLKFPSSNGEGRFTTSMLRLTEMRMEAMKLRSTMFSAYSRGDGNTADAAATKLLALSIDPSAGPNLSGVVHDAHTVAGLVAFDRGDYDGARAHLISSIASIEELYTDMPEPRLVLAEKLLKQSDTSTVIQFLERAVAARTWIRSRERLNGFLTKAKQNNLRSFGEDLSLPVK